jgi:ubiquinone/menaquinone biosynthesis C-methylase UbiE
MPATDDTAAPPVPVGSSAGEHRRAVRAEYDERAPRYDNAMHVALADAVAAFCDVDDALDARPAVVDVATGTGLVLRAVAHRLAARGRELRALGVDLSPGMLAVARQKAALVEPLHAQYALADATGLPLPDHAADLVTCVTALHLFDDPAAAFQEWARVVAPDGVVVTATFASQARPGPGHAFRTRHEDFRAPEVVAAAGSAAGLRLTRHQFVDLPHDDVGLLVELAPA